MLVENCWVSLEICTGTWQVFWKLWLVSFQNAFLFTDKGKLEAFTSSPAYLLKAFFLILYICQWFHLLLFLLSSVCQTSKSILLIWSFLLNLLTYMFNCLPNISTWISQRYLKLSMSKAEFIPIPSKKKKKKSVCAIHSWHKS